MQNRRSRKEIESQRVFASACIGLMFGFTLGNAYSNNDISLESKMKALEARHFLRGSFTANFQLTCLWFLSEAVGAMVDVDLTLSITPRISFALVGGLFGYGYEKLKIMGENCCGCNRTRLRR